MNARYVAQEPARLEQRPVGDSDSDSHARELTATLTATPAHVRGWVRTIAGGQPPLGIHRRIIVEPAPTKTGRSPFGHSFASHLSSRAGPGARIPDVDTRLDPAVQARGAAIEAYVARLRAEQAAGS